MVDTLEILKSILAFPLQCNQVIWEMASENIPHQCFLAENVVISGMGGSALGGRIISNLERQVMKIPIIVSTEYHLPNFVGPKTLVVISSYSGDTEETISSLAEAQARSSQIFIVTSGGKLADIARSQSIPHYIYEPRHNPSKQPRMGLGYSIMATISLLSRCQLIHPISNLGQIKTFLSEQTNDLLPYEELAKKLFNTIPIIVTSEHLKGAAHVFKNQLNETGKTFACTFDIPELNHHLMEGLSFPKSNPQNLHFLLIETENYNSEVKKRYPLTKQVISNNHIPSTILTIKSPNRLFDALYLVQAGALTSYFLSQLNQIDPGPVPWVEFFKHQLPG